MPVFTVVTPRDLARCTSPLVVGGGIQRSTDVAFFISSQSQCSQAPEFPASLATQTARCRDRRVQSRPTRYFRQSQTIITTRRQQETAAATAIAFKNLTPKTTQTRDGTLHHTATLAVNETVATRHSNSTSNRYACRRGWWRSRGSAPRPPPVRLPPNPDSRPLPRLAIAHQLSCPHEARPRPLHPHTPFASLAAWPRSDPARLRPRRPPLGLPPPSTCFSTPFSPSWVRPSAPLSRGHDQAASNALD